MRYKLVFVLALLNVFFYTSLLSAAETEYKVGPSDMIRISVINEPGLETNAVVSVDGSITFPYLGTVYVKGMSISAIEKKIADGLSKGYIKYPIVAVSLLSSTSTKFFVYGEVRGPGGFPFEEGMTVVKAISRAGGIGDQGLYGKIKVRRKQDRGLKNRDIEIDLKGKIEGSETGDMLIKPDDIIIVERSSAYFMTGAVVRTGEYVLTSDMTVMNALSVAGGIRAEGQYGKITVRRKTGENTFEDIQVDLKGRIEGAMTGDMLLQPNDSINVELNSTYFLNGEINRPGQYVLEDDITLRSAIAVAGGIRADGQYGKITVRRKLDNNSYEDIEAVLSGTREGLLNGDMLLKPNDSVTVGHNNAYFVNGEVMKPGEYVLKDGITVFKALTIAGGFTKWGSPDRVKILRSYGGNNGYNTINVNIKAVIKGDASEDVILLPDDIVVASTGLY